MVEDNRHAGEILHIAVTDNRINRETFRLEGDAAFGEHGILYDRSRAVIPDVDQLIIFRHVERQRDCDLDSLGRLLLSAGRARKGDVKCAHNALKSPVRKHSCRSLRDRIRCDFLCLHQNCAGECIFRDSYGDIRARILRCIDRICSRPFAGYTCDAVGDKTRSCIGAGLLVDVK